MNTLDHLINPDLSGLTSDAQVRASYAETSTSNIRATLPNDHDWGLKVEPAHLLFVPESYRTDPLFTNVRYKNLCKKKRFQAEDVSEIFEILQETGGFTDLIIAADEFAFRKKHKRITPLFGRILTTDEVKIIVLKMYDENAYSRAKTPGLDVDEGYEFNDSNTDERLRYRVNICSYNTPKSPNGVKLTARGLPTIPPSFDDLNVPDIIRLNCTPKDGLIVVAGETGSGKSTLCASFIRHYRQNEEDPRVIVTYEKPIEFIFTTIPGNNPCFQHSVGDYGDFKTFYDGLKNALRVGPEIIYIGECRERESFMSLPKIAESGHLGLTTLHARSVSNIFSRVANEVDPSYSEGLIRQMIQYMQLGVCQRLVPSLDGKQVPVQEILHFTPEVRHFILDTEDGSTLIKRVADAVEKYGQTFVTHAKQLMDTNRISEIEYKSFLKG